MKIYTGIFFQVLSSLEAQTWLPGDDYEATDYFPVAKV